MKYSVRITKKSGSTVTEDKFSDPDFGIAKDWARRALEMDEVESAEVIPVYDTIELSQFQHRFQVAVKEFGEKKTLDLLDAVLLSNLPAKTKAARLEVHPGFQLLPRLRQREIHYHFDWENMSYLARQLCSALAVENGLRPVSKNAPYSVWTGTVFELRKIYNPSPKKKSTTRAEREARRAAHREERQRRQPVKARKG